MARIGRKRTIQGRRCGRLVPDVGQMARIGRKRTWPVARTISR